VINLKDRPDVGWNFLLAVSLLVCVVAAAALFYRLPPDSRLLDSRAELRHVTTRVHDRLSRADMSDQEVKKSQWREGAATIGSAVLNSLAKLADSSHVQLGAFRTDKVVQASLVQKVPFIAVVEGAFTDVMGFVAKVERPDSKLAVNLLQIASSDSKGGNVTATLGIVAFLPSDVKSHD